MSTPASIFSDHDRQRSAMEQVALAATAAELPDRPGDLLVIALRPGVDSRKVLASPGNSAIRAAISVAVAAGNTRAWADVEPGEVVEVQVNTLPEIIRASVEPVGVRVVQVAVVTQPGAEPGSPEEVACYTMWLSPAAELDPTVRDHHVELIDRLEAAATADHAHALERAAREAAITAARAAEQGDRSVGRPDSPFGVLGGLPGRDHLDRMLDELDAPQAAVMVLTIDDADRILGEHGDRGLDSVREFVASRLVDSVRKHDVVARIDADTFALVLVNVDRRTAFDISRRLRTVVSDVLPEGDWPESVAVSVGLSHEDGLFDAGEMFAAATSAMNDARLEGGARMLVAC
jgi:diguanylate cyclase (GGDEF)-like protein